MKNKIASYPTYSPNKASPIKFSKKILPKSLTIGDSHIQKEINTTFDSKIIHQLTTAADESIQTKDKSDFHIELNINEENLDDIVLPKNLSTKFILSGAKRKKHAKEVMPSFINKLKGIISKGGSKDFKLAFKDIIDMYINRGYKIPNLSISNNLFKLSPLLVSDDKLVDCYEKSKGLTIKDLSSDKNVLYLCKLLNLTFENQFKIPGSKGKDKKSGKTATFGRNISLVPIYIKNTKVNEEKLQLREIKKIKRNIEMLRNVLEEKEIEDKKKIEESDKKTNFKLKLRQSLDYGDQSSKLSLEAKEIPRLNLKSELPLIQTKSKNVNYIFNSERKHSIKIPSEKLSLPLISPILKKNTKNLHISSSSKTYKTELVNLEGSNAEKEEFQMNKKLFLDYVFNNIQTNNLDDDQVIQVVTNYCKNILNFDQNQVHHIINQKVDAYLVEDTIKKITKKIEEFNFMEKFKEFRNFMDIETLDSLSYVNDLEADLKNLNQDFIRKIKISK